jgi:hypothetical protein
VLLALNAMRTNFSRIEKRGTARLWPTSISRQSLLMGRGSRFDRQIVQCLPKERPIAASRTDPRSRWYRNCTDLQVRLAELYHLAGKDEEASSHLQRAKRLSVSAQQYVD